MSEEDWLTMGICPSCIGALSSYCFCRAQINHGGRIVIDFISNKNEFPPQFTHSIQSQSQSYNQSSILKEQVTQPQLTPSQPIKNPNQPKKSKTIAEKALRKRQTTESRTANRKVTKDNISHKRFSIYLQDAYKQVTGVKVPKQIQNPFYHREDYFIIILTLLEKKGKVLQAFQHFQNSMTLFKANIQEECKSQVERLQHFKKLISRYLQAYRLFLDGEIHKSMETVYDYQNMRQKRNFTEALNSLWQRRKSFGLSFEP